MLLHSVEPVTGGKQRSLFCLDKKLASAIIVTFRETIAFGYLDQSLKNQSIKQSTDGSTLFIHFAGLT